MGDLDPSIILAGADTTRPIQPMDVSTAAANFARAREAQAGAQLTSAQVPYVQAQTQGMNIKNQLDQMTLAGIQAYQKAATQLQQNPYGSSQGPQAAVKPTPVAAQPSAPGAATSPGSAPNSTGTPAAGGPVVGTPSLTSAPTSPGTTRIDPSDAPAPAGISPAAWEESKQSGLKINPNTNWYENADGTPASFTTGPRVRPDGSPNTYSLGYISDMRRGLIANGAPPQYVNDTVAALTKSSQSVDTEFATLNDLKQKAAASQAAAAKDQSAVQDNAIERVKNLSFEIANSGNPVATYQAYMDPNKYGKLFAAAGLTGDISHDLPMIDSFARVSKPGMDLAANRSTIGLQSQETATSRQSAATSRASELQTEQATGQTAATFASERTAAAGGAAQQVALVQPALQAINDIKGNQLLINNGLNTPTRQLLGSEPAEIDTHSLGGVIESAPAALHSWLQYKVGSAASPGTPANILQQKSAPIIAALLEASTVAEKEQGATAPRNEAYIKEMRGIAGQLDNTKVSDPAIYNHALDQAAIYLHNYDVSQRNNLGVLNATNPNGKQQGYAATDVTSKAPKVTATPAQIDAYASKYNLTKDQAIKELKGQGAL